MPLAEDRFFGNRHTHSQLRCFLKMAAKAMYSSIICLMAWIFLSEQLILHLPRTERRLLDPIAGTNWLQFVSRFEPIDFVTRKTLGSGEMWMWPAPLHPWRKSLVILCGSHFLHNAYALGTMTREQDARCIILSILLSMKLFALFTRQLPLLDVLLVVAVFWVMAGCPVACYKKLNEVIDNISETVKDEGNDVQTLAADVKMLHEKTDMQTMKFDRAYDAYEKRVAELEVSNPELAKALKAEVASLVKIYREDLAPEGVSRDVNTAVELRDDNENKDEILVV